MKHEFALFYKDLPNCTQGMNLTIVQEDIVHRIVHVLRLKEKEQCVFFAHARWARVSLQSITKKMCIVHVDEYAICETTLAHKRIMIIPVLKRDALESALYQVAAAGVTAIQLVYTKKTRTLQGKKEHERLERIIIAAAEQSKNFTFPLLYAPVPLDVALAQYASYPVKLYADVSGKPLFTYYQQMQGQDVVCMVGPEGDLLEDEKDQARKAGFVFFTLTRTVLTAEQAASLSAGIVCLQDS